MVLVSLFYKCYDPITDCLLRDRKKQKIMIIAELATGTYQEVD